MFNFDLGVIVELRYMSRYEVFCNRCSDSIGTMTFPDIKQAVFATLGRGGVLCPTCRKSTCDSCGLLISVDNLAETRGPKGVLRACRICRLSLEQLYRDITAQIVEGGRIAFDFEEELPL